MLKLENRHVYFLQILSEFILYLAWFPRTELFEFLVKVQTWRQRHTRRCHYQRNPLFSWQGYSSPLHSTMLLYLSHEAALNLFLLLCKRVEYKVLQKNCIFLLNYIIMKRWIHIQLRLSTAFLTCQAGECKLASGIFSRTHYLTPKGS